MGDDSKDHLDRIEIRDLDRHQEQSQGLDRFFGDHLPTVLGSPDQPIDRYASGDRLEMFDCLSLRVNNGDFPVPPTSHSLLFLFDHHESDVIVDDLGTDVVPQVLNNLLLDLLSRSLPMLPSYRAESFEAI